jgi:hypothetical protein
MYSYKEQTLPQCKDEEKPEKKNAKHTAYFISS